MNTPCLVTPFPYPGPRLVRTQPLWIMPTWMERYRAILVNPVNPYPASVEELLNSENLEDDMKERKRSVSVQITLLCRLHEEGYL